MGRISQTRLSGAQQRDHPEGSGLVGSYPTRLDAIQAGLVEQLRRQALEVVRLWSWYLPASVGWWLHMGVFGQEPEALMAPMALQDQRIHSHGV